MRKKNELLHHSCFKLRHINSAPDYRSTAPVSRNQIATGIAILFYLVDIIGIIFFDRAFFISATPFILLSMLILVFYTQQKINTGFIIFIILCVALGISIEIAATKTSLLPGEHKFGEVLGTSIANVPLIIGINWLLIIYSTGIAIHMLLNKIIERAAIAKHAPPQTLKALAVIVDGATFSVLFDWLMEPAAIKLGFWHWAGNGAIPFYNYLYWFFMSALLLSVFHYCSFEKQNKFAINLLLIQAMFFLLVRTVL